MRRDLVGHALLLARTTKNLRASQVAHRVRLRAQRWPPRRPIAASLIAALPTPDRAIAGWPDGFRPLDLQLAEGFPSPEENARGRFTFLADGRELGSGGWDAPGASRLWRYHLHYMEWAWSFAAHPDRTWARATFADLWRSWAAATPFGRGDPWSPYVASLRAWALCGTYDALVAGSQIQPDVDASLRRHARFVRLHLEHDVGGNHLLKNLKALVGLGVFLGEDALLGPAVDGLRRQIPIQILSDGGHYERSPSYHCQVLADLVDVQSLLVATGRPAVPGLATAVDAMRTWLGAMLMPDGDVPLLNDSVLVGADRLALLRPGPRPAGRLTVLPASGYVVVPGPALHLVAAVGDPCPPDLPAHAHADCLSFELAAGGRRVVVDTGTSTYEPGARRAVERSTPAHNSLTVDGADQTEVWGTFRAARLAHGRLERADDDGAVVTVVASHDGYRRLPGQPVHRRTWEVAGTEMTVVDEVVGEGDHDVDSFVHLAPGDAVTVEWTAPGDVAVTEATAVHATGFGHTVQGRVLRAGWHGPLPVIFRMELRVAAAGLQGFAGSAASDPMRGTV
ncbi:MAG TPA: alginate lyase family protein [Acidimicrobiales bacterium]|nr:alginate lyase family protein [Acidimicrobiales bacterium]